MCTILLLIENDGVLMLCINLFLVDILNIFLEQHLLLLLVDAYRGKSMMHTEVIMATYGKVKKTQLINLKTQQLYPKLKGKISY